MKKGLIHAIANCSDCEWRCENYLSAQVKARRHNRETGHKVMVELGYRTVYERKKKP